MYKRQTTHPQATQEIDGMISMIQTLMDKGYAYAVADGTVYFRVKKFKEYGKLSHKNLDDLQSGFRALQVSGEDQKEDPLDFVLWKPKKEGEPFWKSPWSDGRPGWHIECSVMSRKYLGEQIDIHAGGEDLIFPHHENEIAQSEAANGKEFARYWMHNAFLNIDNRKMSKSLGNFRTVREISEQYDLQVLRFFMLSAHYRSPLNFSADLMEAAKLDGCGYFRTFLQIFMPLMKGALATQLMLWFMGIWNDYLAPTIFLRSEKNWTLQVVIRSFNSYYAIQSDYALIMAASVIAMIPTMALFFIFQRMIIESIAISGIK